MSHFLVLLTHLKDQEDLACQMLPFCEDTSDLPEPFLAFVDNTAEYREEYETGQREEVLTPDGTRVSPWTSFVRNESGVWVEKDGWDIPKDALKARDLDGKDGFVLERTPWKKVHATFEEHCQQYHNEEPDDQGRYGYFSNPNAKWDWYTIGGRWKGFFRARPGCSGELGESGAFGNESAPDHFDWIQKSDIDFDAMMATAGAEASVLFDQVAALYATHGVPVSGDEVRTKVGEDHAAFREYFWGQPALRAMEEAKLVPFMAGPEFVASFGDGTEAHRAHFVETARLGAVCPYAILHEGQWLERGEMGMFGMSNDKVDKNDWVRFAWSVIDGLPDDARLCAVDCHI